MKIINPNQEFNVEVLKQIAKSRKTITPLFRLPMTPSQAFSMICGFYKAEVESRHRNFCFDEDTNQNIVAIANALTSEHPKLGLLLCGDCGNGKTTFLYALQNLINWLNSGGYFEHPDEVGVQIINARELAALSQSDYSKYKEYAYYKKILSIDDMGEEPHEVLDYGNIRNPVVELIELRYNRMLPTFITSNLDPDEIREKYHERIADRLREMVEILVFERSVQHSYRKL